MAPWELSARSKQWVYWAISSQNAENWAESERYKEYSDKQTTRGGGRRYN